MCVCDTALTRKSMPVFPKKVSYMRGKILKTRAAAGRKQSRGYCTCLLVWYTENLVYVFLLLLLYNFGRQQRQERSGSTVLFANQKF